MIEDEDVTMYFLLHRYPEDALEYGVKNAALVFAGCPDSVERTVCLSSSWFRFDHVTLVTY